MKSAENRVNNQTKFIIDDREARSGVIELLRATEKVSIEIARLSVGDYQVDEILLFERKTFPDLIESIKDKRLFRQGYELANRSEHGIMILEGQSGDLKTSKMRREALQGALITLTVLFGLPLLRSSCLEETIKLMLYTAAQKQRIRTNAFYRQGRRPCGKKAARLYVLQGLPGIGPERAENLLDHFGSVEAVFNASEMKLAKVIGIGRKISEKIRWTIGEPVSEYSLSEDIYSSHPVYQHPDNGVFDVNESLRRHP